MKVRCKSTFRCIHETNEHLARQEVAGRARRNQRGAARQTVREWHCEPREPSQSSARQSPGKCHCEPRDVLRRGAKQSRALRLHGSSAALRHEKRRSFQASPHSLLPSRRHQRYRVRRVVGAIAPRLRPVPLSLRAEQRESERNKARRRTPNCHCEHSTSLWLRTRASPRPAEWAGKASPQPS